MLLLKSFSENSLKASRIIIPGNKLLNAHNSRVIRGKQNGSWYKIKASRSVIIKRRALKEERFFFVPSIISYVWTKILMKFAVGEDTLCFQSFASTNIKLFFSKTKIREQRETKMGKQPFKFIIRRLDENIKHGSVQCCKWSFTFSALFRAIVFVSLCWKRVLLTLANMYLHVDQWNFFRRMEIQALKFVAKCSRLSLSMFHPLYLSQTGTNLYKCHGS